MNEINTTAVVTNEAAPVVTAPAVEAPVVEEKAAKKVKRMKLKVRRTFKEEFGISIAAALRFLGRKKVPTANAVIALRNLGVKGVSMHTIRTQLYCGKAKKLSHGPMPKVSAELGERLLAACQIAPVVKESTEAAAPAVVA